MVMTDVALATEDELSEAIGIRILSEINPPIHTSLLLRKGGYGYLRSKMDSWCKLARHRPVFLLTDLDNKECPSLLIESWFGQKPRPENLLLRVAVREVESWLLADHEAMRFLIGARGKLPQNPDALEDPKQSLLQLARYAKRDVRQDLVVETGTVASQGIGYNARLGLLVKSHWSPRRAAERSSSLNSAIARLEELARRCKR
jgi:hypothetical protein